MEQIERVVQSGQIPYMAPVKLAPHLDLVQNHHSTIAKAAEAAPVFQPSIPQLDRPLPLWETFSQVRRYEGTVNTHSIQGEKRIGQTFDHINKINQEQSLKLEEAIAASKDVSFWSILEDVGNSLMSSVSFFYGFTALSTGGTAVGGALIASGVLSLSTIAFKHAQAWDWIADQIAGSDKEMRQAIKTYVPAAVGIIAAGIGVYGAYSSWQYSHLNGISQTQSIIQTTATVVKGITDFGKGRADSHSKWTNAQVSALQSKSDLITIDLDNIVEEVKNVDKKLTEVLELAARLFQDNDRAIQSTQQPV